MSAKKLEDIIEIKYEIGTVKGIDNMCLTVCPHGYYSHAGTDIKVGSYGCCKCKKHVKRDVDKKIVYCDKLKEF